MSTSSFSLTVVLGRSVALRAGVLALETLVKDANMELKKPELVWLSRDLVRCEDRVGFGVA